MALVGAASLAACDAGPIRIDPATLPADPLVLLGTNVGTNRPMPENGAIQLSFNRYILPSTVVRQSITISSVGGAPPAPPAIVLYDPVARTVTLRNPSPGQTWLTEGQSYRVDLKVPSNEDKGGLLAIDGAPLERPLSFQFLVGASSGPAWSEPKVSLCADVLPILAAKCLGSGCHSGTDRKAAASLVLDSSLGIKITAVNRVAQASNTSGRSTPLAPRRIFGLNMPLVDPGNPGNSWLLYKMLLAPLPPAPRIPSAYSCTSPTVPAIAAYTPLAPYSEAPTERETRALQDFLPGREMPFPAPGAEAYEQLPLTFAERERVRLWIAEGADVPDCDVCRSIEKPQSSGGTDVDAAVPSAPVDAGSD